MNINDPIADLLTRIRNAHKALHKEVKAPFSKVKRNIAVILKEEGYIEDYSDDGRDLTIVLKYLKGKPAISGLKRISTPGRRMYTGANEIPSVQNGLGVALLSTNKGLLTGDSARAQGVGGELLCRIW